jgi:hypothetical protein
MQEEEEEEEERGERREEGGGGRREEEGGGRGKGSSGLAGTVMRRLARVDEGEGQTEREEVEERRGEKRRS